MKKILALVLSVLMILALVACGQPAETTAPDVIDEVENDETPVSNELVASVEGAWGEAFWADFKAAVAANAGATADVVAGTLYSSASGAGIGMGMVLPMEAGYFQGFMADVTGFKSAAVIAPMMSSALLVYVFELEADANVREFVSFLSDNADPSWMICMTAETTTIAALDNYVLVAYAPSFMPGAAGAAQVIEPMFEGKANTEALWNDFVSYMEINGSFSLASDVADYLAGNELMAGASVEVLEEMVEVEGFAWSIEAYTNGAAVKAGNKAIYVFQLEMGMMPDAWGDYNLGMNAPEGADSAWGAYGETLILMVNIEA